MLTLKVGGHWNSIEPPDSRVKLTASNQVFDVWIFTHINGNPCTRVLCSQLWKLYFGADFTPYTACSVWQQTLAEPRIWQRRCTTAECFCDKEAKRLSRWIVVNVTWRQTDKRDRCSSLNRQCLVKCQPTCIQTYNSVSTHTYTEMHRQRAMLKLLTLYVHWYTMSHNN